MKQDNTFATSSVLIPPRASPPHPTTMCIAPHITITTASQTRQQLSDRSRDHSRNLYYAFFFFLAASTVTCGPALTAASTVTVFAGAALLTHIDP